MSEKRLEIASDKSLLRVLFLTMPWVKELCALILAIQFRLHYISPSNLRLLLLLLSLQLKDLSPYASKQGLIRPKMLLFRAKENWARVECVGGFSKEIKLI